MYFSKERVKAEKRRGMKSRFVGVESRQPNVSFGFVWFVCFLFGDISHF